MQLENEESVPTTAAPIIISSCSISINMQFYRIKVRAC